MLVPKDYRKQLLTFQKKFGNSVEEFSEEDYQKYLEVEKLKKLWGKDVDTKHPLLLEIKSKLDISLTEEEMSALNQKAEQFKQEYLSHSKHGKQRELIYEYNEREAEK